MKTLLLLMILFYFQLPKVVESKEPQFSTVKRAVPLLISQKSYTTMDKKQPVRHLIEIAHGVWNLDGVELSMDSLIIEGGDDLMKFKAFMEGLREDCNHLRIMRKWSNFEFRLSCDFERYNWIDEEVKAEMVNIVLCNLPVKSWTICCSNNCKPGQIMDRIVVYRRHISRKDMVNIALEPGEDMTVRSSLEVLQSVYDGPVFIAASKLSWKADEGHYCLRNGNNPNFLLTYKDDWFKDKNVYRMQNAIADLQKKIKRFAGFRVLFTTGQYSTFKVQAYERELYKEVFEEFDYMPEYVVLESSEALHYDLNIKDNIVHSIGDRLSENIVARIESKVGNVGMGSSAMRSGYLNIHNILTSKRAFRRGINGN